MAAFDMARRVDIDTALTWHLRSNIYPPVPLSMLPACKEAIEACVSDEPKREIKLPTGVFYKGQTTAPASAVVEGHHLEVFVEMKMEGEE